MARRVLILASVPLNVRLRVPEPVIVTPPVVTLPFGSVRAPLPTGTLSVTVKISAGLAPLSGSAMLRPVNVRLVSSTVL